MSDESDTDASRANEEPTLPPSNSIDDATLPPSADPASATDLDTLPPSEPTAWQEGGRIEYFGDYELLNEIARGGMGVVYRARQTSLNRIVALKMILAGQLAGQEEVQRFHAEAEAAANLDHPGIVPIYEVGEYEGQHYFSMGFVDGSSLSDLIADRPLAPEEAAELTCKIADAIGYAHEEGVIHRDLKPANVLVPKRRASENTTLGAASSTGSTKSGLSSAISQSSSSSNNQGLSPRVTDFGLAKQVQGDDNLTASGQILGTPNYMPPEQAAGKIDQIDHRADVYSLGGILYALITGRPPFQAANQLDTLLQVMEKEPVPPRQLAPKLPRDIETIALKALEKDPKRRYQSAHEMSEDLRRFLAGEPIHARSITPLERGLRWCKRKPAIAGLLGLAASLLLLLSIGGPMVAIQQANYASEQKRLQKVAADERSIAVEARGEAETASELAAEQQRRAEGLLYATKISLAHREWLDGNPSRTKELLASCPIEKRNWEWKYLDNLTRAEDTAIFAHSIPAQVEFSPSGQTLLTRGLVDNGLTFWDAASGQQKDSTTIPNIRHARFVSETHVLVRTGDSVVYAQVQDEQGNSKPKVVWRVGGVGVQATGAMWVQAKDELWVGFADGSIVKYDWTSGTEKSRMPGKLTTELIHAFSPDGKLVAAAEGQQVRVLETETGQELFTIDGHVGKVQAIEFSPDGRTLASCGRNTVFLTNCESQQRLHKIRAHQGAITSLAFSPDGKQIVTGSMDRTARLFDVGSGSELFVVRGHERTIKHVTFHPDGDQVATSSEDGSVRIWNVTGQLTIAAEVKKLMQGASHRGHQLGLESRIFYGHLGMVYDVEVSPNGQLVATAAAGSDAGENQIRVWSLADASRFTGFPVPADAQLHTLEFSSDNQHLVVSSGGAGDIEKTGSVTAWNLESNEKVFTIDSGSCKFIQARLNAKNDLLAVIFGNDNYGHIRTYSFPEGELLNEMDVENELLSSIAFAKDQDIFLTSTTNSATTRGGTIRIWDARNGTQIDTFQANGVGVFAIDISSKNHLAAANMDGSIGIWNWQTKKQLAELKGHNVYAADVCFSPDGERLLSSSEDETVKIWDLSSYSELLSFRDHRSPAMRADWSQDGSSIATTARDGTLIVRELKRASARASSEAEWITFFQDDFERSELGADWASKPNEWKIQDGRLVGTLQAIPLPNGSVMPGAFAALVSKDLPRTFELEADVVIRQPMLAQVIIQNKRTAQYIAPYVASTSEPWGFAGGGLQIARESGDQTKLLSRVKDTKQEVGTVYHWRISRDEGEMRFYVNDRLLTETRIPAFEAERIALSGCWSKVGDQIEFDNLVVRVPKSIEREMQIRELVDGWLTDYLLPGLVDERIRKEFAENSEDFEMALGFLQGVNANDAVSEVSVLVAIEAKIYRPDASAEEYTIAAQQAEAYMKIQSSHWWHWSKFALAYLRDGDAERALKLLDRTDQRSETDGGHLFPMDICVRSMALHALGREAEAEAAQTKLREFRANNEWNSPNLVKLEKELEEQHPVRSDSLKEQLLVKIRESRSGFYQGKPSEEFENFAEDAQIAQGRNMRSDEYDLQYDRDEFLKLESIYSTFYPVPNLHIVRSLLDYRVEGERATIALVENYKIQEPEKAALAQYKFGLGYQFEKRGEDWRIVKHRVWKISRKRRGTWEALDAEYWEELDAKIEMLVNGEDSLVLAQTYQEAERFAEALKAAQAVVADDSRPVEERGQAMGISGECLVALRRFDEGLTALEKARELAPANSLPWFMTRQKDAYSGDAIAFSLAFDKATQHMASSHQNGQVVLWDLSTAERIKALTAHSAMAADVAYIDGGQRLVTAGWDRTLVTVDLETDAKSSPLLGHAGVLFRLENHPSLPNVLVSTSADGTAKVWDLEERRELFSLAGHGGAVMSAAFSPDGSKIATACEDGQIHVWNAQEGRMAVGREIAKFRAHAGGAARVDWTPDGSKLVSVGKDRKVRIWNAQSHKEIAILSGHNAAIDAVRVSPDGRLAASGDEQGVIFVWDLEKQTALAMLNSHTNAVYDLQFFDGDLFSASADTSIRRWDIDFTRSPLSNSLESVAK